MGPRLGGRAGSPLARRVLLVLTSDLTVSTHSHVPLPVNGTVREENVNSKSVEEITSLVQKLANQSGLDVIRIRKPFHTDNPSIQGQWHPFTNKRTALGGLRPRELQDPAAALEQAQ